MLLVPGAALGEVWAGWEVATARGELGELSQKPRSPQPSQAAPKMPTLEQHKAWNRIPGGMRLEILGRGIKSTLETLRARIDALKSSLPQSLGIQGQWGFILVFPAPGDIWDALTTCPENIRVSRKHSSPFGNLISLRLCRNPWALAEPERLERSREPLGCPKLELRRILRRSTQGSQRRSRGSFPLLPAPCPCPSCGESPGQRAELIWGCP